MLPRLSWWSQGLLTLLTLTLGVEQSEGKIYDRCELARELHDRFKFSKRDLDKWLCLAYWESRFDTRAYHKGRYDGSGDHGIFQINDKYWCQPYTGYSENVCKVPCYMLRDDNLEDDIQCVNKIFRRHGFHAWMLFTHKCSGNTLEFYNGCEIKNRKGTLPRLEAEASSVSVRYERPMNHSEEMETSASGHDSSRSSTEELIHTAGGNDYSTPQQSVPENYGYSPAYSSIPAQSYFPQSSVPQTVRLQPSVGDLSLLSTSLNNQNQFLGGQTAIPSQASYIPSSAINDGQLANPMMGFSGADLAMLSSQLNAQQPVPQQGIGPGSLLAKAPKPGVIKRLQGAVQSFRPLRRGRGIQVRSSDVIAKSSNTTRIRGSHSDSDESK